MFGNCCGRKKKEKKTTRDAETQSDNEVLAVIDDKYSDDPVLNQPKTICDDTQDTVLTVNINEIDSSFNDDDVILEVEAIVKRESGISDENETGIIKRESVISIDIQLDSDTKRESVVSDTKIEIFDEDDEVFCEGIGPPVRLNDNLGRGKEHILLPKWFSQDDDQYECDGLQEPPATPIGKDELALRRHRFFSELLSAAQAQNSSEHKVRFDPMGPVIAGSEQPHELENIVTRLENITERLENVCVPVQELLKLTSTCTTPDPIPKDINQLNHIEQYEPSSNHKSSPEIIPETKEEVAINMSLQGYQDIIEGPLAQYIAISNQIGGDVAKHSSMVHQAFHAQLTSLIAAGQSKKGDINSLVTPTGKCIIAVQEFREKNRPSPYFNHLSAISESIPALGWIAVSPTPAPYVKEMNDAGQFYTNRVLKDWKEKDKKHVDWVKAWVQTLTELQAFVKQHHTTGLVWGGGSGGCVMPPPPPPNCPPPPPALNLADLSLDDSNNDRSALFAQINQGENITKSLKKVTDEMQTHKNPTLRTGPAPFKAPTGSNQSVAKAAPVIKPPSFVRDGKKWLIEYQKGNNNLVVDGAEMNNVVYLFKCENSTITVKGKINSITLDSCKKTSVVFDSLVSCIEFINCQSVQMQVLLKVPTVSIDKTDGCQIYLSKDALDVEVVSSKSSEMNIMVPQPNGEYSEYPVPEQYKTTVVPGKGLQTIIVENKG